MREKLLKKKLMKSAVAALLLVGVMSMFYGCSTDAETEEPAEEVIEVVEEYISEINRYETPDGVFRAESSYTMIDNNMEAKIVYPLTGNDQLDREIESYVQSITSRYSREAAEIYGDDDMAATLTMEYTGYIVDKRFAGVKMAGVFDGPYMAHPEDIVKTFNGISDGRDIVRLSDIIKEDQMNELSSMTVNATGAEVSLIDDAFLDNWNLTDKGLEITLERGKYGPMSDGTRSVLFTYAELSSLLVDGVKGKNTIAQEETDLPEPDNIVIPPAQKIDPDKPMVALTFDDGPGAYTDRLLDIFQTYGGQGTFFLMGNKIDKRIDTVQRIVAEGHEVGGHSWSHKELTKISAESIESQLVKTRNKIYEVTGVYSAIMRPPYGSYDDNVKAVAKKLGISAINWNVDTLDWKNKDPDYVYKATMKKLKSGNIILFHDIHPTTVDAMERIIPDLLDQGYQLVTVSQLLTAGGGELVPGKLYYKG